MRCLSCNCILTDFEATRKYENGEYVDLCNSCLNKSDMEDIVLVEREDLKETDDVEDFDNPEEF
jgi:hypothetical protein